MLNRRDLWVALPEGHPLAENELVEPQEVVHEQQIVFNYNVEKSFREWTTGAPTDENVVCTVDTVQSALDLVAAGIGISVLSEDCVIPRDGVTFVPVRNWHRALYMCILYDKWLEPPVWAFVEQLVRTIRSLPEK